MEITPEQFALVEHCLPKQRGNVSMTNLQVVNAMLYVAEHGCKWRGLPKRFGNWHTVYTRMRRWTKAGVLDKMFEELQREQVVRIKIEAVSLDSTSIKVHPDGTGALKKKRTAGHRQIPRRMEHQGSSGCRGCSNGRNVLPIPWPGTRCARGQAAAPKPGYNQPPDSPVDGPRLRRQRDTSTGSGPWLHPGRATDEDHAVVREELETGSPIFENGLSGLRRIGLGGRACRSAQISGPRNCRFVCCFGPRCFSRVGGGRR